LPPAGQIEYLDHYVVHNLRLPAHTRARRGELFWDHRILDETAMRQSLFYAEFLPRIDFRYFVSAILETSQDEFTAIAVHRSARQGHIDRAGTAVLSRLVPHLQQAFDVARRLRGAGGTRGSLERTLDWLGDGVALIAADGAVVHANEAFRDIVRHADGIRVRAGVIEFAAPKARDRLADAIEAMGQLRAGQAQAPACSDFSAPRTSGMPAYIISVRPLVDDRHDRRAHASAAAIVFVHDPVGGNAPTTRLLREMFGLTEAEAGLAQALCDGVSLGEYARSCAVSLNTVYTHLRRIKEKTGCKRMSELIRKLDDLRVSLRPG
jgi:DNA-binding CsgD family transcriptional regulator/PAS domain-containing protein